MPSRSPGCSRAVSSIVELTPADIVSRILADRRLTPSLADAEAEAPANIALVKYWGKRNCRLNLPVTSSLSISLGTLGTRTSVHCVDGSTDELFLNDRPVDVASSFFTRTTSFLDLFRPTRDFRFRVETINTVPTAAGLASSASGIAALVRALDRLFVWRLSAVELSILARLGSGSACRSIFDGFVEWRCGTADDGMDSYARPLSLTWPGLCIGVVTVNSDQKAVSSRDAMQRSIETSPFYCGWPRQVAHDLREVRAGIDARAIDAVGRVAETNALVMHATMSTAQPPVLYWMPETVDAMHRVWTLREHGVPVYFTMDAGPNLKLIFEHQYDDEIRRWFPEIKTIRPFADDSA